MIERLVLRRYGAFEGSEFDFGGLTLFVGGNESGKSTIFDALFDQLCDPRGTSAEARSLRERYGERREAQIVWKDGRRAFDAGEFLNLYAVRSGAVDCALASGASWSDKIRTSLFSGGVDPTALAERLEKLSQTSGNYKHVTEYRRLGDERASVETRIAELARERSAVLESERAADEARRAANEAEGILARSRAERARLLGAHEQQKLLRERGDLVRILDAERQRAELSERAAALSAFAADAEGGYREIEEGLQELVREESVERGRLEEIRSRRMEADCQLDDLRLVKESAGLRLEAAERYMRRAQALPAQRTWNPWYLLGSLLSLAAAAAALVLPIPLPMIIVCLAAGCVIAALCVVLARRPPQAASMAAALAREWAAEIGQPALLGADLGAELEAVQRRCLEDLQRIAQAETGRGHLAAEERRRELLAAEKKAAAEALADRRAAWLAQRGVSSIAEYHRGRGEYVRVSERLEAAERFLAEAARRRGGGGLRAEAAARLEVLERSLEAGEFLGEREFQALQNRIAGLEKEIESASARARGLETELAERRGRVRGSLGRLPEETAALEARLVEIDRRQADLETERAAAAMAAAVFRELARDSELMLRSLAAEIAEVFGALTGDSRATILRSLSLGPTEVLAADGGGVARRLDHLSKGTRAAFMLAARLVMARRADPVAGLVVLDEPFESLDSDREARMFELLARFHEESGWQIVLLSKEPRLAALAARKGARVHELDRSAGDGRVR